MRYLPILLLIFTFAACNNSKTKNSTGSTSEATEIMEIRATPVDPLKVPHNLKFRGQVYEAWKWTDKLGENLLVLSTVHPYADNDLAEREPAETAELHAFLFVKKDTAYKLRWKISDAEKKCRFDLSSGFIKESTTITDLDKDGVAETSVIYKQACRSDVSPSTMKLVMNEDSAKYVLKGLMWLQANPKDSFSLTQENLNLQTRPKHDDEYDSYLESLGRYEDEKGFASAPPAFLKHAKEQWLKFVRENLE